MTPIKECLNKWIENREAKKQDIKDTIKELEILEDTKPFNSSQWEIEMSNLRRLRQWKDSIDWFITSLVKYDKISDEEILQNITFEKELEHLINKYSLENSSNTPDFILSKFMSECLQSFNYAVKHREKLKQ
jgi:hypothetical protein